MELKGTHSILLSRRVTVETVHKPLEVICKKSLLTTPQCLQRILLWLPRFDLDVIHKKGSELYLADLLSRAPVTRQEGDETDRQFEIFAVQLEQINPAKSLRISDPKLKEIKTSCKADEVMQELMSTIQKGWPGLMEEVPLLIREYFQYREELCTQDGLVFRGAEVIVPQMMRRE